MTAKDPTLMAPKPSLEKHASVKEVWEPFNWQAIPLPYVVGLDEVGRGCLAGPVFAGAAIIPVQAIEILVKAGVTDSKLLSEKKREALAPLIQEHCMVALGSASVEEIDQINILQASFLAMRRAVIELDRIVSKKSSSTFGPETCHFLIDGNQRLPFPGSTFERYARVTQTTLVKGDLRALPVAAAAIVAKVTRDRLMIDADQEYPVYGFKGHKGYAAEVHRTAIKEHGPSPLHRKTFGGVREYIR